MMIGEVAHRSGLNASAIRYYETQGLLPRPLRSRGQRRYDGAILERLALLQRARDCGFTLAETRQLLHGFRQDTLPSERWQTLARKKLAELEEKIRRIEEMKRLLLRKCECRDLEECGRRILRKRLAPDSGGTQSEAR
jgi:MerR family redox-sensitive transcriptional activator SoxR